MNGKQIMLHPHYGLLLVWIGYYAITNMDMYQKS
jgi:hypothetical protein